MEGGWALPDSSPPLLIVSAVLENEDTLPCFCSTSLAETKKCGLKLSWLHCSGAPTLWPVAAVCADGNSNMCAGRGWTSLLLFLQFCSLHERNHPNARLGAPREAANRFFRRVVLSCGLDNSALCWGGQCCCAGGR